MSCHSQSPFRSDQLSPRTAVNFACCFLNVLTGRKPATDAEGLATAQGRAAFARVRRRVPTRLRQVRVRRITCPRPDAAEIIAMVEDGRSHQAMTFTFRATTKGWRLDDCELIHANRQTRR